MTNKFFQKKLLVLALIVMPILTQSAYSQNLSAATLLSNTLRFLPATQTSKQAERKPPANAEMFLRTELFFGTDRENGVPVSEEEWQQFLNSQITPRFPDGLTVLTGIGQFRLSTGQIIQERSMVLILLYPVPAYRTSSEKIEQIRIAYRQAFQQQSVLRVDTPQPVWVSF